MIATRDLAGPQPTRLYAGKRIPRPDLRLVAAGMGWLALFALLALTGVTLWRAGIISSELLFWEARRRLIVELQPPDLTTIVSTDPALVLLLLLPAGPVSGGVALLGTVAVVVVSAVRRWVGLGALWLPLLLIQPGVAIALVEYPSVLVRTTLYLLVLACLLAYVRGPRVVLILSAALGLGALTLVDAAPWPLWIFLGSVLWWSRPMPTQERISLLMVTFFPAVFLVVAWQYLSWTMHLARTGLDAAPALLFGALPDAALTRAWQTSAPGLAGLGTGAEQLLVWAPGYVLAVALLLLSRRRGADGWTRTSVFLLLAPAVDILARSMLGYGRSDALSAVLPALSLLLAASMLGGRARFVIGVVLLAGALVGWGLLLRADGDEPARLARRVAGLSSLDPLQPLRGLAAAVDTRVGGNGTVLLDDAALFPVVALVREPSSLMLPYRAEFALAVQQPEHFADLIVTTDPSWLWSRATAQPEAPGYGLVCQAGQVSLYARGAQAPGGTAVTAPPCSP